ncbi:MAG TPA: amidase [Tepidisphaeraceae bacterium]|nr:amidase [Tepidisphaeraceae bacterium]
MPKQSRRSFLRSAAAGAAAVATAAPATADSPPPVATTAVTTTATTTAPATTKPKPLPADDVAALVRSLGHDFTPPERAMMADGLADRRDYLKKLRQRIIDPRLEPAVQFNPRVPSVRYPTGDSRYAPPDVQVPDYNGDVRTLAFATVGELSRLIHAGKLTSTELTRMYLDRLDHVGRRLNAVITLTPDLAIRQAQRADQELRSGRYRGPLHGIPYGAKDLLATKGIATTWGVKPFEHQAFDYDATVIEKLEQAGAVLCAKLSLGELAMGDVWFGGQTKSPWDPTRGSGGSSAGPAAAVAAGCVGFAIGSETMGSIISPCMTNGVTGLRPTYGRVSRYGAMPLARTMDKIGPMCRGVEDCAMVLFAIHGADERDPTAARDVPFRFNGRSELGELKVGFDVAAFEQIAKSKSAQRKGAYEQALSALRGLAGGELRPIQLPPTENYTGLASLTIAADCAASFSEMVTSGQVRELVQQGPGAWPDTFRKGMFIPAADYLRAQQLRSRLMRAMHEAMQGVDLYVTIPYAGPTIAYTNLTGHPTLVTRCGMVEGQPLMIELLAQPYREDAALRLGLAYEQSTQWSRTWPAI